MNFQNDLKPSRNIALKIKKFSKTFYEPENPEKKEKIGIFRN